MTDDTTDGEGTPAGRPAAALARVVDGTVAGTVRLRPYDPERPADPAALWRLKRAFERDLGGVDSSADDKAAAYGAKLTDDYRERYLAWVRRCVADGPAVWLAVEDADGTERGASDGDATASEVVGYAFLLPERLAMVWDGAVLNELYVVPAWRGTGVADALLGAVVEQAREQDLPMDRLLLDVAPSNERAQAFYDRHGFRPWGEMVARDL